MARQEQPREDLLRDAVAFVNRIELTLPDRVEPVFAGFRQDGAVSVYFDHDHVLQFNAAGCLRRVFWEGLLYKAHRERLVRLRRIRHPHQVELESTLLGEQEQQRLLQLFDESLRQLADQLADSRVLVRGEVHQRDVDVRERLKRWLDERPSPIPVAQVAQLQ